MATKTLSNIAQARSTFASSVDPSIQQQATPLRKKTKHSLHFGWIIILILPLVLTGSYWGWQQYQFKDVWRPGFVDLGVMRRDLRSGDTIQIQVNLRTTDQTSARTLSLYLQEMRRALVDLAGETDLDYFNAPEGKDHFKAELQEKFSNVLDKKTNRLIDEVLFTEFLLSKS